MPLGFCSWPVTQSLALAALHFPHLLHAASHCDRPAPGTGPPLLRPLGLRRCRASTRRAGSRRRYHHPQPHPFEGQIQGSRAAHGEPLGPDSAPITEYGETRLQQIFKLANFSLKPLALMRLRISLESRLGPRRRAPAALQLCPDVCAPDPGTLVCPGGASKENLPAAFHPGSGCEIGKSTSSPSPSPSLQSTSRRSWTNTCRSSQK